MLSFSKLLLRYLRDRRYSVLSVLIVVVFIGFFLFLSDLSAALALYGLALALLPVFSLFFVDFWRYRRRYRNLYQLKTATALPASHGETLHEELLRDFLLQMDHTLHQKDAQIHLREQESLTYYTLWVHQIKTPIAAMRLILQQETTPHTAALRQELFKIERYADMVLGYLRIDSLQSDLSLHRQRAYLLVKAAVKTYMPVFLYQKLTLSLEPFPNEIVTDQKWLVFVLEQLLSNALKYTPKGSIEIHMDSRDVLRIKDTGIGIAEEDLPRIFERGFTGQNGRLSSQSSGLGLFLCKRILDKLGHSIEIQSSLGKGTTVLLHLHQETFMKE